MPFKRSEHCSRTCGDGAVVAVELAGIVAVGHPPPDKAAPGRGVLFDIGRPPPPPPRPPGGNGPWWLIAALCCAALLVAAAACTLR